MKKYLRYADVLVLFAGALGLLLRLMVVLGGTDDKQLYPANPPAFVLACVLSVAVVVAIWMLTRRVGMDNRYKVNFPRSLPGAIGCGVGAVSVLMTAAAMPSGEWLATAGVLSGIGAGGGLIVAAYCRYAGKKPHFISFLLPTVFFTLRTFLLGQTLGAEPEVCRYLFEMLANLAMIPACYQLWGFTVDMGDREKSLFWSLTAAFLSMVAIPNPDSWLLHLGCAAWMLTNLCPLKVLRKQVRQPAEEEIATQDDGEAVNAVQETTVQSEPIPAEPVEALDVDAILADILKEIDKNVE